MITSKRPSPRHGIPRSTVELNADYQGPFLEFGHEFVIRDPRLVEAACAIRQSSSLKGKPKAITIRV
jgi:hypothetical protein